MSYEMVEPRSAARLESAARPIRHQADPDGELVARWQAGDGSAFEALVGRHQLRVFRLLLRMLGSREEAEDAAQDAFLSLHRHGHRFRRESRFSTFVYRVAANAALNRRRTLGRGRSRVEELKTRQQIGADLPSSPRNPEDAAGGAELQAHVQRALCELPADLRAAVVLYDIEGQSYRDIARILDVPEGTVKSRIHRARSALRKSLRPLVSGEPGGEKP
jgi:RNA polymerase sigma-70 factor (ECF subfamily)